MDVNALPTILETKRTLAGEEKSFRCRVIDSGPPGAMSGDLTVLFISDRPYRVAELELPIGTITFGHFWLRRPYNVYHWLTAAGATLGFYFNLSDQLVIGAGTLAYRDLSVDLLACPGAPPQVLDEHELPADLDADTHQRITQALDQARTDLPALGPALEAHADRLWADLFGGPRR
jgi:hypothetical protein